MHEVQALEDVACLVFLSDQFDSWFFATNTADRSEAVGSGESRGGGVEVSEEKMVIILRKTWSKMGRRGRELALQLPLPDRARAIIDKALTSDDEARPPSVTTASN